VVGGTAGSSIRMPDRMLQSHNTVAALQHRPPYNSTMNTHTNHQSGGPVAPRRGAAIARRSPVLLRWAGLAAVLLGLGVLAAGCGGVRSRQGVASLGTTTTTTTAAPSAAPGASRPNPVTSALGYSQCMRTHGVPNFPEPTFHGHSANISITPSIANSPFYTHADTACKHFLPNDGVPPKGSGGPTLTPADQADYLKAAVCMRSHGITAFPDPTFKDGTVAFNTKAAIDTNSAQYTSALATCQKLIPAGLPYSSSSNSSGP
jgi:hypothetical protein